MTALEMLAVAAAGLAAGGINAVVGSGTLVTFPVLLAVGLPPVTATISNSPGLVPGNLAGSLGDPRGVARARRRPPPPLPPPGGRAALAAAAAAARLGARRADRLIPPAAPAGEQLRGDRAGADRARRRPRRRAAAGVADPGAPALRGGAAVRDRPRPAGRAVRRRLRHRLLRRLLRRQPGRAADRRLRAAAARVAAAAQRDEERAHPRGQRGGRRGLRR